MKEPRDNLESRLAGIVERAATNGCGLGVAMPAGIVGGRFGASPPADPAQDAPQPAQAAAPADVEAMNTLVLRIAAALAGANMDHAVTALISLAVHYAMSDAAPPELRLATMQRMLMGIETINGTAG